MLGFQNNLVEASEEDIIEEEGEETRHVVELVWRERLPLGMNLLTNDESGKLKVVDFPRGSQARLVCERRNYDPDMFEGATIVGVNGTEYDDSEELFEALRDPARPKTVQFQIAETEEIEKLRQFVESSNPKDLDENAQTKKKQVLNIRTVQFISEKEIGIEFEAASDDTCLVVSSFLQHDEGIVFAAEKSNKVKTGDVLCKVNDTVVCGSSREGATNSIKILEEAATKRPLHLSFCDPYLHQIRVTKTKDSIADGEMGGPAELVLEELPRKQGKRRIAVSGFKEVGGRAEASGILIGDHLVFVNGMPVGAACRWLGVSPGPALNEVYAMIRDESAYPMGLTFGRHKQSDSGWDPEAELRDENADTICVTSESQEHIGCLFDQTEGYDIIVRDFFGVAGSFQHAFLSSLGPKPYFPLTMVSLNGQFVPTYASPDMIRSALSRCWKQDGEVEVILCNDELQEMVQGLQI